MKRITETEVAKMVRHELAAYFPSVKFSVKTKKYSGGSSLDVSWTDGPTSKQVERVAGHFHGADFDGMQDLKEYNNRPYANDYIFFNRSLSPAFEHAAMSYACKLFGFDMPAWIPPQDKGRYIISGYWDSGINQRKPTGEDLQDIYHRVCSCSPAVGFEAGSQQGSKWDSIYNMLLAKTTD